VIEKPDRKDNSLVRPEHLWTDSINNILLTSLGKLKIPNINRICQNYLKILTFKIEFV
jgi:hypothetical protein